MSFFPFLALVYVTFAAVPADKVDSLPGFDGNLPSAHYSGYLPTGVATKSAGQLHYWLIESENNPSKDPIVLWLNGGPGSSSLIGLLQENGQVTVNDDSLNGTGTPKVFYNPYSWSSVANMLYLESPKGVGFSYCETSTCHNTDESTALDAHEFLVNFFKAYPEYADSDFYITGESYAGVYIPMLIDQIETQGLINNFKGAAIGNGCWGSDCFYGITEREIDFHLYAGHYFISRTLEDQIKAECGDFSKESAACKASLAKMSLQTGNFYVYNIYDECGGDTLSLQDVRDTLATNHTELVSDFDSFVSHPKLKGALNDYKCGGDNAMDKWLADPSVVSALHVKAGTSGMRYSQTCGDLRPLYKELFQKHRIIIYSGDVDGCVPYYGSEKWTREMGFRLTKDWHPWKSDTTQQKGAIVAGYAIEYEHLTLVTVKGAGHMVPQFKPVRALTMFTKFINNEAF